MAEHSQTRIKIGFHLGPQHGDYPTMRRQWIAAEELGADALYSSDHFFAQVEEYTVREGERPPATAGANFEGMTLQAAMAATTSRAQIGCLVHAIGYRNPNLLADMARTIDHISGGRFILGLGTGYLEQDYVEYGYPVTTQKERSLELAASLPVIKDRLARLNPPPLRKMPILIAAMGGPIGLRCVAEHADIWHVYGAPDFVAERIGRLRQVCAELGRDFAEIELATWYIPEFGLATPPDDSVAMGIGNIIHLRRGPDWDHGVLRELLQWRDACMESAT